MGHGISKEKIKKIILKCAKKNKDLKIDYKYKENNYIDIINSSSIDEAVENKKIIKSLNSPKLDIDNTNIYPYNSIGDLTVKFPNNDYIFHYTCFLINSKIVVTLASNLIDNKGEKAQLISTSFSEEEVNWENIFIEDKSKKEDNFTFKNKKVLTSKLAVIIYKNNLRNEWLGVEAGKKEEFVDKTINAVFTLGNKNIENYKEYNKERKKKLHLREINVNDENPFIKDKKENKEIDEIILEKCPGSPIYYKDYSNGAYVIAIINEYLEFQYFEGNNIIFLIDMINKTKKIQNEENEIINENNIFELDLSRYDFGPKEIKYLVEYKFKNLKILDLSSNSVGPEGTFYISKSNFINLESLNLNFNEIGDEGLFYLKNSKFMKLKCLYLFHCNLSPEGIKYLVQAKFINKLIILSLSENQIFDTGIRIMKEEKVWNNLSILNLNHNELSSISLIYLLEADMPKLKKLNIQGNNFDEEGKKYINQLRIKNIHVSYRTQQERDNARIEMLKSLNEKKKKI